MTVLRWLAEFVIWFWHGPPAIVTEALIPYPVAATCLDCDAVFDMRSRRDCPGCGRGGWALLASFDKITKKGKRKAVALSVVREAGKTVAGLRSGGVK